jgi:uncharacterized protein YkwD
MTGQMATIIVAVVAATGSLAIPSAAIAPPVAASATTDAAAVMAADLAGWINRDRAAAGLRPYRAWPALASIATQRAGRMAATNTLSHTVAGSLGTALNSARVQWYSFGEIIGVSGYPWGYQAIANLYKLWKASPVHHAIMFSSKSNYLGVGLVRGSNGKTWASIVFTESVDHTPPGAWTTGLSRSGTTLTYAWRGYDPALQTHTAGLRGYNVQYRIDNGPWHVIGTYTTATWLRLYNRPHGHYYGFRVQAADRRGNLSPWTAERRIYVY